MTGPLPYHDTKPVGAADFYFAINATFRFIRARLGEEGLIRYWTELGRGYFAPVAKLWRERGLPGVARYWKEFFAAEPGADIEVNEQAEAVVLEVRTCPAIAHLRANGREIDPGFCRHCYYVSEAMAEEAGLTIRVEGGQGSCRQSFFRASKETEPQDLRRITSCA